MGPLQATIHCMRHPFKWRGRAAPSEYWWFFLVYMIGATAVTFMLHGETYMLLWEAYNATTLEERQRLIVAADRAAQPVDSSTLGTYGSILVIVFYFWVFFANLSVCIRRFHDTGRSGWWFWIILIPIVGWLIMMVMMAIPGDFNRNDYGPPPGSGGTEDKRAPRPVAPLGDVDPIGRPRSEVDKVQGADALRALRQSRMPG